MYGLYKTGKDDFTTVSIENSALKMHKSMLPYFFPFW